MYEDYLKKMKDECLLRNRAESTYNTYENHVIKFLEWVKKNPDEVTLEDARNYILRCVLKGRCLLNTVTV